MQQANYAYSKSQVCRKANALKKRLAAIHGGTPKQWASEAFRRAWASEKNLTSEIVAMRERVQAVVAEVRFQQSELGRAQHAKRIAAVDADIEASLAKANALLAKMKAGATPPMREAA